VTFAWRVTFSGEGSWRQPRDISLEKYLPMGEIDLLK